MLWTHILTKGDNNGTGDAICHDNGKNATGPGILQSKLELVSLVLEERKGNTVSWPLAKLRNRMI